MYLARLVVVGWTGVGKTSLIHRMLGKNLPHPDERKRTLGIVIHPWKVSVPSNTGPAEINLSIWDFAGQMDFYPLHQQFLIDDGTFCMIVFNSSDAPEKSSDEIKAWLSILRNGPLHEDGSLPLLVGTHKMTANDEKLRNTLLSLPDGSFFKYFWLDSQPLSNRPANFSDLKKGLTLLIGHDKTVMQGYNIPKSYASVISKIRDCKNATDEQVDSASISPSFSADELMESDCCEIDMDKFRNAHANASWTMPSRTILRWEDFEDAKKNDLRKKPFLPVDEFFDTFMSELTDIKDRQTLLSFLKASDEVRLIDQTVFIDPQWLFQSLLGPIPFIRSKHSSDSVPFVIRKDELDQFWSDFSLELRETITPQLEILRIAFPIDNESWIVPLLAVDGDNDLPVEIRIGEMKPDMEMYVMEPSHRAHGFSSQLMFLLLEKLAHFAQLRVMEKERSILFGKQMDGPLFVRVYPSGRLEIGGIPSLIRNVMKTAMKMCSCHILLKEFDNDDHPVQTRNEMIKICNCGGMACRSPTLKSLQNKSNSFFRITNGTESDACWDRMNGIGPSKFWNNH